MELYARLCAIADTEGVSGFEDLTAEEVVRQLTPLTDDVYTDALGNVIGYKKGKESEKTILLEAHMDEVGLIVTKVLPGGFLYFAPVGGIDPKILPAAEVRIHGKKTINGVIGSKPPHLGKEENIYDDLYIDTGLSDATGFVSVGDFVSFIGKTEKLLSDRVTSKSLDNRACVAMILSVLEKIGQPKNDVYIAVSTGEELGLRGAKAIGHHIRPDIAVVTDVTFGAGNDGKEGSFALCEGVAILFGADCDRELCVSLYDTAKEMDIPVQKEIEPERSGTDATAIQTAFGGTRTVIMSVPIRYMHSSCEVLDLKDLENGVNLLSAWIENIS